MLGTALLSSIATLIMANDAAIELSGKSVPIRRTSSQRLKMVSFTMDGREYTAIEQNPEKPSRWGQLAREGHQVVQFKDNETNRFVAVTVDGTVRGYGSRMRREQSAADKC